MDSDSFCVCICRNALSGTGVEPPVALAPLELPPPAAAVREFDALAGCEAALPEDPDSTLALPPPIEAEERADVELAPDDVVALLARFSTPGVLLRDAPLAPEAGFRSALLAAAPPPAPAPDDEPAVAEATAATVPLVEPWMYRSCRLPGFC